MSISQDLMLAAGMVGRPTGEASRVLVAYICRTWDSRNPCTLDGICSLALKFDVDPVPLMRMAQAAGDIELGL